MRSGKRGYALRIDLYGKADGFPCRGTHLFDSGPSELDEDRAVGTVVAALPPSVLGRILCAGVAEPG